MRISRLLAQPPRKGFQAVIKLAASAASPKTKSRETRPRATPRRADGGAWGASLGLGSLDLVFGEAALAADLITAGRTAGHHH